MGWAPDQRVSSDNKYNWVGCQGTASKFFVGRHMNLKLCTFSTVSQSDERTELEKVYSCVCLRDSDSNWKFSVGHRQQSVWEAAGGNQCRLWVCMILQGNTMLRAHLCDGAEAELHCFSFCQQAGTAGLKSTSHQPPVSFNRRICT